MITFKWGHLGRPMQSHCFGQHREKTVWAHRRQPFERRRPHEKPNLQYLDHGLLPSRTVRKSYCLSQPVCGILLLQASKTKTAIHCLVKYILRTASLGNFVIIECIIECTYTHPDGIGQSLGVATWCLTHLRRSSDYKWKKYTLKAQIKSTV